MPSTPTTRSQVHAYRFLLKRMESALVRRDPVMLHDPMRSQVRAVLVGLFVAVLALGGFAGYGRVTGSADWQRQRIVLGRQSGAIYVVVHTPDARLVPVPNLASARLILATAAGDGGAGPGDGAAQPTVVSDDALAGAPRTEPAGIPGAPSVLPSPDHQIPDHWALCDTTAPVPAPAQGVGPGLVTTVLAGVEHPGTPLRPGEGLLVRSRDGAAFLVYGGRRARVDLSPGPVSSALDLVGEQPKLVSTGLLNAIPEAPSIVPPVIPRTGAPGPPELPGLRVGSVFSVTRAGTGDDFYVVVPDGIQPVSRVLADLVRFSVGGNGGTIPKVLPEQVADLPRSTVIDPSAYPQDTPRLLPAGATGTVCLDWSFTDGRPQTAITIADAVPSPVPPTQLHQPTGSDDRVDYVYVPGQGVAVRSVVPGQDPSTGTIFVVSPTGTVFGVPDVDTARILGIGDTFEPAPDEIIRLLPAGVALDEQAALTPLAQGR